MRISDWSSDVCSSDLFGLIEEAGALRIYGSGIVSSFSESRFALDDPSPNRIRFDLERVMRTEYRIDHFQQNYFVIPSFDELLRSADRRVGKECVSTGRSRWAPEH